MLTIIELPLQILEMTQSSTFMEHWTFRKHEIQKGGPQIMTSWYDDVVPGMLPIFGHGSDNACSTCHMVRNMLSCNMRYVFTAQKCTFVEI